MQPIEFVPHIKSWVVEYYNMKIQQWEVSEPCKLRFISHCIWNHRRPTFSAVLDEIDLLEKKNGGLDEISRRLDEWETK